MNNENVKEWLKIADYEYDSAKILNEAVHKHCEVICYLCMQAVEKYLKGYLTYKNIIPQKTHDLVFLCNLCAEKDNDFQTIKSLCEFLNLFITIRYPHRYEVTEDDAEFSIKASEKVRDSKPIVDLINNIK